MIQRSARALAVLLASILLAAATALSGAAVDAPQASAQAVEKPRRIVSLNLCTDQLVVLLADREAIASVTFLAADPVRS